MSNGKCQNANMSKKWSILRGIFFHEKKSYFSQKIKFGTRLSLFAPTIWHFSPEILRFHQKISCFSLKTSRLWLKKNTFTFTTNIRFFHNKYHVKTFSNTNCHVISGVYLNLDVAMFPRTCTFTCTRPRVRSKNASMHLVYFTRELIRFVANRLLTNHAADMVDGNVMATLKPNMRQRMTHGNRYFN